MASIKKYNLKIDSLKNTKKITNTMKMVSASKLRKAQKAQISAKLYAKELKGIISRISTSIQESIHPLLEKREKIKNVLLLVFTSDKGLCGSFNANVNKSVEAWITKNKDVYENIDLGFCGKRGKMFFKNYKGMWKNFEGVTDKPTFHNATSLAQEVRKVFEDGTYDEVYVVYNAFISPLAQTTMFQPLLPIAPELLIEDETLKKEVPDYIFEPSHEESVRFLIPHYLYFSLYFYLLENAAGEYGARMTAMDSATKNANELISKNTLLRNRARQASITTELIEIVAGAEALK